MVDASAWWGSFGRTGASGSPLSGRADQSGNAMKVRLLLALMVAVLGAGLISGPAAAAPPTEEEFSPVGDRFLCGETLVTVRSGTVLEREHVNELGSGLSQVIVIETPIEDVILTDEEGNDYRLVGTARGNFVTAADPEDEFALESGFFAFKANLIGEGGLFGSIDFLLRRQNGNELIRDRGSCHFA
jgi:hypothetical protein